MGGGLMFRVPFDDEGCDGQRMCPPDAGWQLLRCDSDWRLLGTYTIR